MTTNPHTTKWMRFRTFVRTRTGGRVHVSWQRVCVLSQSEGYAMVRYDSSPFHEHDHSVPFVITDADWNALPVKKPESAIDD